MKKATDQSKDNPILNNPREKNIDYAAIQEAIAQMDTSGVKTKKSFNRKMTRGRIRANGGGHYGASKYQNDNGTREDKIAAKIRHLQDKYALLEVVASTRVMNKVILEVKEIRVATMRKRVAIGLGIMEYVMPTKRQRKFVTA